MDLYYYDQYARNCPPFIDEGIVAYGEEPEFIYAHGALEGDQMEPFVPIYGPRTHFSVSFFNEAYGT